MAHIDLPASAPLVLHVGAAALLFAHVGGGAVGIVSGFAAMAFKKGGRAHRIAGNVFFGGMLSMTLVGAAVAPFLSDARWTNTTAAVFTFYLVVTAWATVKRPAGQVGLVEALGFVIAAGISLMGLALLAYGLSAGRTAGFMTIYAFATFTTLAAVCDWRILRAGGVTGPARTARHLWRMGLALAIAAGSYFLGQPRFVPEPIRGAFLAAVPPLTAVGLIAFWMLRTRAPQLFRRRRPALAAGQGPATA